MDKGKWKMVNGKQDIDEITSVDLPFSISRIPLV